MCSSSSIIHTVCSSLRAAKRSEASADPARSGPSVECPQLSPSPSCLPQDRAALWHTLSHPPSLSSSPLPNLIPPSPRLTPLPSTQPPHSELHLTHTHTHTHTDNAYADSIPVHIHIHVHVCVHVHVHVHVAAYLQSVFSGLHRLETLRQEHLSGMTGRAFYQLLFCFSFLWSIHGRHSLSYTRSCPHPTYTCTLSAAFPLTPTLRGFGPVPTSSPRCSRPTMATRPTLVPPPRPPGLWGRETWWYRIYTSLVNRYASCGSCCTCICACTCVMSECVVSVCMYRCVGGVRVWGVRVYRCVGGVRVWEVVCTDASVEWGCVGVRVWGVGGVGSGGVRSGVYRCVGGVRVWGCTCTYTWVVNSRSLSWTCIIFHHCHHRIEGRACSYLKKKTMLMLRYKLWYCILSLNIHCLTTIYMYYIHVHVHVHAELSSVAECSV